MKSSLSTIAVVISLMLVNALSGQQEGIGTLGDVNEDGNVDLLDVFPFCDAVFSEGGKGVDPADLNEDGNVDLLDVAPFRVLLRDQQGLGFQNASGPGPGDFFWSTAALNSGAVNQDLNLNLDIGDTAKLYLYYTANGPSDSELDTGAGLNVATSASGVIAITGGETLDFPIANSSATRWSGPGPNLSDAEFGPATVIDNDLLVRLTAFTVCLGDGIVESNTGPGFVDQGYDAAADAFLYGCVEISPLGLGTVNLVAGPNDLGIVNNGSTVNAVIANATINVIMLGDVNLDGFINLLDVNPFIDRLSTGTFLAEADCNQDGFINLLDVSFFIDIVSGN